MVDTRYRVRRSRESYRGAKPPLHKVALPFKERGIDKIPGRIFDFPGALTGRVLLEYLEGVRLIDNPSESQVINIWQNQLLSRAELTTEQGETAEIIYPGRVNDEQGADFRDAVVAIRGRLIKGDIEVHVKSSDWQAHRHHQDAVYNRVILHVVMWHNAKQATHLQNGGSVPVLALHKYIRIPAGQWPNLACYPATSNMPCLKVIERLTESVVAQCLDRAGKERFLAKVASFREDLAQTEASQSLYRGIMGALGYSKNKLPFLELANRLPLYILESVARSGLSDEECLARQQALLLGTAGLLPSQRYRHRSNESGEQWIEKLERLWDSLGCTEAMAPGVWCLFKVRPSNSPIRRLVAMSYLVLRYRERGIFEELASMVKGVPLSQGGHRLEKGLLVTASGYWASHFDFGLGSRMRNSTLLGSGRAADIIVNVLLPFTFAWGRSASQSALERKAFELYHHYPKLAVNSVGKHMKHQLGLSGSLVNSAQRQQGLIHIYNTLCTQGKCNCCPLSQSETGHHIQI